MTVIGEIRKKNLRRLIDDRYDGVVQRLAKDCNIQHSQLWRVLKDERVEGQPRYVGERLARKIEEAVGLHVGWMDQEQDRQSSEMVVSLAERIAKLPEADRLTVERMISALSSLDGDD